MFLITFRTIKLLLLLYRCKLIFTKKLYEKQKVLFKRPKFIRHVACLVYEKFLKCLLLRCTTY